MHPNLHSFPTRRSSDLIFTLWLPPSESPGLNLILGSINKYADTSVIPPADDIFQLVEKNMAKEFLATNGVSDYSSETFEDRKSTRLNSSHQINSYAVFC